MPRTYARSLPASRVLFAETDAEPADAHREAADD
jgi:hypothetical protein